MIDPENEVFTRVATVLRSNFPGINVSGEYVNAPSSFPHVSVIQSDNFVDKRYTSDTSEMSNLMFEANVYSNDAAKKKSECKKIMNVIDGVFRSMNFRRTSLTPVPNLENATIYRLVARYSGKTDGKYFYRS